MKVGELLLQIGADSSGMKRGFNEAEKAGDTFSKNIAKSMERAADSIKRVGEVLATAFVFDKLKEVGGHMLKLAMEAENSEATFKQVFGNMASDAEKFSNTFSKAMGANSIEVRKQMSVIDAIIKGMGLSDKAAADMSKGVQQMTYDLSAFRDVDIATAFYKIRSGLTGETEPLKEVGILTTEEILNQVAYRKGIAKTGAQLTEQQKVLARYAAIQESLTKQGGNGQWVREMSSASAQLKIAKARYEETAAVLGQKLLPIFTKLLNATNSLIDKFNKLPEGVQTGVLWFGVAVVAAVGLTFALGTLSMMISSVANAFTLFRGAGAAISVFSRIGGVVAGVVPLLSRLWTLIRLIGTVGLRLAGPIGIILSFVLLGLESDVAKTKIGQLWETLKGFLGFSNAASGAQEEAGTGATNAWDAYNEQIKDATAGLGKAKKASDKFVASFDELYSIPDTLDSLTGTLPTTPTTPTTPTGGSIAEFSWIKEGPSVIDDFLDALKLIPEKVNVELSPIPSDMGAGIAAAASGAWVAAQDTLANAVSAISTKFIDLKTAVDGLTPTLVLSSAAFLLMLTDISTNSSLFSPIIVAGIALISSAMGLITFDAPVLSVAFKTMMTAISSASSLSSQIVESLYSIFLTMGDLITQSSITSTAFNVMLNAMQSDVNAFQPYISWGLVLIMFSMLDIVPASIEVSAYFHGMLDNMQSKVNAYQPYISYGILMIVMSLLGLSEQVISTDADWSRAWQAIRQTISNNTAPILKDIKSIKDAYNDLMDTIGKKREQTRAPEPALSDTPYGPAVPEKQSVIDQSTQFLLSDEFQKNLKEQLEKATISLGEFGIDSLAGGVVAKGAKAAQAAAQAAAKEAAEVLTQKTLKNIIEKIMSTRNKVNTPSRTRPDAGELGNVSGFASGGIIGSDSIVRVGERGRREAIVPIQSGAMNPFADAIADRMGGGGFGGGNGGGRDVYIGTFDPAMLKNLERALKIVRLGEESRGGGRTV